MRERKVTIVNRLGMHARASAKFVTVAGRFESDIRIAKGKTRVDGKSIMGIMMLATAKGDKVVLGAEGPDAVEALDVLSTLIGKKFGEGEKNVEPSTRCDEEEGTNKSDMAPPVAQAPKICPHHRTIHFLSWRRFSSFLIGRENKE